jgi:hypothetical protein
MKPTILETILTRLSEQSTWRGIILLATACGLQLSPAHWEAILSAGLSIVAVINIFRKEPRP